MPDWEQVGGHMVYLGVGILIGAFGMLAYLVAIGRV
jgi:hypothetical protein